MSRRNPFKHHRFPNEIILMGVDSGLVQNRALSPDWAFVAELRRRFR